MNLLASFPVFGSRSTKHFWLLRIVARITSGGMPRKAASKLPISTTGHSTRPGDFFEQAFVLDQLQPLRQRQVLGVGEDVGLAPVRVGHDLGRVQLRQIILEPLHLDRPRRVHAVAVGDVAGFDAVDLEFHDLRLLGLRPEGAEDRMQRPHPVERARAPAHRLRPRKRAHHLRNDLRDHLRRRPALALDDGEIEVALLVGLHLGFADRFQPGALEKSLHRRVGRADARAFLLLAPVRLLGRQPVHRQRNAPRRGERLGAVIGQARVHQLVGDELLQILHRPALHPRRDFLGEQFEQKVGHYLLFCVERADSAPGRSRCSGRRGPGSRIRARA